MFVGPVESGDSAPLPDLSRVGQMERKRRLIGPPWSRVVKPKFSPLSPAC